MKKNLKGGGKEEGKIIKLKKYILKRLPQEYKEKIEKYHQGKINYEDLENFVLTNRIRYPTFRELQRKFSFLGDKNYEWIIKVTGIERWDPVLKTASWLLKETKWDNVEMRKKAIRWLFEKVAKDFIKISQSLKEKRISLEEAERYLIENDLKCFGYRSFVNFGLFGLKNYYQKKGKLDYLKILKEAEIDKDYPLLEKVFWLVIKDISWDREKEKKVLGWLLKKTLPEEFLDLIGKKAPLKKLVDMMIEKNIFYSGRDEFYKMHLGGIIARSKGMVFEIYKSHNYVKKNPVFREASWFCLKRISSNYWRNIHNQYKAWFFIANILCYKSLSDLKKAQEKGEVTSHILRRYRLEASWIEKRFLPTLNSLCEYERRIREVEYKKIEEKKVEKALRKLFGKREATCEELLTREKTKILYNLEKIGAVKMERKRVKSKKVLKWINSLEEERKQVYLNFWYLYSGDVSWQNIERIIKEKGFSHYCRRIEKEISHRPFIYFHKWRRVNLDGGDIRESS